MPNENILYTLTFGFMQQITGFVDACQQVLFTSINIFGQEISLWALIGGTGAVVVIIAFLAKLFT